MVKSFFENNYSLDKYGIFYHSKLKTTSNFQNTYLNVRKYEKRIFSDEELKYLPYTGNDFKFVKEWKIRQLTVKLLFKELTKIRKPNVILDIGCGNAWLSNLISEHFQSYVIGIDNNYEELIQAKRVFKKNNKLILVYVDLLTSHLPNETFDVIIISSAIQYFHNFGKIISDLLNLLKKNGCIFIHDSIFYNHKNIINAKKNTKEYYKSIGFPNMADYYFHHKIEDLTPFDYEKLYDPLKFYRSFLKKIFPTKISPFFLIKLKK